MYKKLIFLICFVSVLVLASSGLAAIEDFHWDGDSEWGPLFFDPHNWEEGAAPDDCDDMAYIGSVGHNPTVVTTTIEVGGIRGPVWHADADHELLLIWDANLVVCTDWRVEETNGNTAYITLIENARIDIIGDDDEWSFRSHNDDDEAARTVISMYDDTEFLMKCDLHAGDNPDDYFELNMTDRAYMYIGNCDDGFRQNDGELHVTLRGEAVLEAEYIRWRMRSDDTTCTFDIIENAQVIVNDNDFCFAGGSSEFIVDLYDNAEIVINGDMRGGEDNDFDAIYTINMHCDNSPLIDIDGDLRMIDDDDATGFGQINLWGGTINVGEELLSDTDNWNIDICCNGVLILNEDVQDDVWDWHDSENITAYGGCSGRGDLMVDFNEVNGKTTVWAEDNLLRAWDPSPVCYATSVNPDVTLCWEPGDGVGTHGRHLVYFGTSYDDVLTAEITDDAFQGYKSPGSEKWDLDVDSSPPITLELWKTYYWRIDEFNEDMTICKGDLWSFTTVGFGDLNQDCYVNFYDFAHLAKYWLTTCVAPDYCGGADLTKDCYVDINDLYPIVYGWLDVLDYDNPSLPRMPYGGKFRRVDIHGVPMPDRSPTGEGEDDRLPNMAYIDMFDLAPHYSVTDAAVPVEGGELTLEFRRTGGIRSFRHSTNISNQGITYPSDFILGLGWDTNLNSRIIVAHNPTQCDPTPPKIASVTDEVGNSYQYFDTDQTGEGNPFAPDMYHSFSNGAVRAKLFRQDSNTLVLVKVFGTRLTYKKIGRFYPPALSSLRWEDYYRLVSIEDRNGNRLEYVYDSNDPSNQMSFLVSRIYEAAHPERYLQFFYTLGTGSNGEDWGTRLQSVTDPLGRVTDYLFGPSGGMPWELLLEVQREAVPDGEAGGAVVQPTVTFSYYTAELPAEETQFSPFLPPQDPATKNRFVGFCTITDARGHITTFSYTEDFLPSSIDRRQTIFFQKKIRLTGASTIDGSVVLTQSERTTERVVTSSQDTNSNTVEYEFLAEKVPADNKIGMALYVTRLTRTTEVLPDANTAVFEWSPDPFANLIHVTDMHGNTIDYDYGNPLAQKSNQPSRRTITDTGSGETIVTTYEYGAFSKMTRMVDGEGKDINYMLDGNGNRIVVNEELGKTTLYQYATDGFVTQITDPNERVTKLSRLFNPSDPNRYYTVTSTVTGYSNELNLDTEIVYDVMGNEVEMVDPEENVYTHEYNALYRRIRTTNPAVEASPGGPLVTSTVEYTYNLNGSVIKEKDDNGNVTINKYDLMNRVIETRVRMTDPNADDLADLVTTNTYDPVGLIETATDPVGNITCFEYDALLRLTRKTFDANDLAYVETYEYGANTGSGAFMYTGGWQPTRVINRRGFAQDTTYDGFYRPIKSIRRENDGTGIAHDAPAGPNEPAILTSYNKVHNEIVKTVLAEAGAGGDRATYTFYDDLHRQTIALLDFDGDANDGIPYSPNTVFVNDANTFTCDANDFVTRTEYDPSDNVTRVTDRERNATDTTYDGANRVIKVEQAPVAGGRPTTTTVYDDNTNPVLVTDPNGNQTQMSYDARNRLTRSILDLNGDGEFDPNRPGTDIVTDTHYDLMNNVIQTRDPRGNVTDTAHDRAYRPVAVTGPAVADAENSGTMTQPVTTIEYDKNGNATKVIDPRGASTVNIYDGLNRVISITEAFGTADAVTTTIGYDENDNIVSTVLDNDPCGLQTTTFTYDPFDRQITETWPGGNLTTTTYYRNDLAQVVTDPNGQKTEFDYDRADRLVTSHHRRSDSSIEESRTFTYDMMDNILTATDANGTTSYTYDALYRVLTETREDDGQDPYTVTSAYDLNGNRTCCTYPQTGRVLTSTYDRLNRLMQMVDSIGPNTTTYGYDENSNITGRTLPNGVADTFTYDALNRVLTHVSAADGPNIYSVTYTYDLADNCRSITETVQGQSTRNLVYDYDDQYRLTSESWDANSYTYTYDLAGNRLSKTVNGTTTNYTYNARNELLTEVTGGTTTTYTYDDNGNRTQKAVGGGSTTDYIWDVHNRLVEARVDSTTVFEAQYDYRTRRLTKTEGGTTTYFRYDGGVSFHEVTGGLTPVVQVEFVRGSGLGGGIGSILYSDRSGSKEYFCYNAVGHTVALTNASAAVVKTDLYEAFGGIVSSTGSSLNNRLANTKERDSSIGLDNHGFRYYDPPTGRYISRDPARYIDGMNVYLYVNSNPINDYDAQGLWGWGGWLARWIQKKVAVAKNFYNKKLTHGTGTVGVIAAATINTAIDLVASPADLLKTGEGVGEAIYGEGTTSERVFAVLEDVGRVVDIVSKGGAGNLGKSVKKVLKSKEFELPKKALELYKTSSDLSEKLPLEGGQQPPGQPGKAAAGQPGKAAAGPSGDTNTRKIRTGTIDQGPEGTSSSLGPTGLCH